MFSCFLVTRTSATISSLFNAASDWVGSCATITKRRRDRTLRPLNSARCDRKIEAVAEDAGLHVVPNLSVR